MEKLRECTWKVENDDYGTYETNCGGLFCLTDGTLKENDMKYCCYCGKKIIEPDSIGER